MTRNNIIAKSVRVAIAAAIVGGVIGTPAVIAKPAGATHEHPDGFDLSAEGRGPLCGAPSGR